MGPAGAIFMDKVCRMEAGAGGGAPSTLDTGTWTTWEHSSEEP